MHSNRTGKLLAAAVAALVTGGAATTLTSCKMMSGGSMEKNSCKGKGGCAVPVHN